MIDIKSKEVKRSALNEVIEYIGNPRSTLPENLYADIVRMVRGCFIFTIYCCSSYDLSNSTVNDGFYLSFIISFVPGRGCDADHRYYIKMFPSC